MVTMHRIKLKVQVIVADLDGVKHSHFPQNTKNGKSAFSGLCLLPRSCGSAEQN